MSDDKIRQAILNGLARHNPLAAVFRGREDNQRADQIMDELKSVLPAHRFNEGDPTSMTPQEVGWQEAYNQLCADLASMLGMENASIAGDHQVKDRVAQIRDFTKRQTFAVLWHRYNNDTSAGAYDHTEIGPWLVNEAFPLLYGEGHCFQCHGFVDEQSYLATKMQVCDHGICPACVQDEGEDQ